MAKKKSVTKTKKTTPGTKKPAKKAKLAAAVPKKAAQKPKKAGAKTKKASTPALKCDWTIPNFKAVYSQNSFDTSFSYARTNPLNATVKIRYSSSVGGGLDNEVSDVANHDSGNADCSGHAQSPWTTVDLVAPGCNVQLELWLNQKLMKKAPAVVQVGP